jgi:hypothetical protein
MLPTIMPLIDSLKLEGYVDDPLNIESKRDKSNLAPPLFGVVLSTYNTRNFRFALGNAKVVTESFFVSVNLRVNVSDKILI